MIDLGFDFVIMGGDIGTIGAVTAASIGAFRSGGSTGSSASGPYVS